MSECRPTVRASPARPPVGAVDRRRPLLPPWATESRRRHVKDLGAARQAAAGPEDMPAGTVEDGTGILASLPP